MTALSNLLLCIIFYAYLPALTYQSQFLNPQTTTKIHLPLINFNSEVNTPIRLSRPDGEILYLAPVNLNQDGDLSEEPKMAISLYSSQSFIADNSCFGFKNSPYSELFEVSQSDEEEHIEYLYYTAIGKLTTGRITLGDSQWEIDEPSPRLTKANKCTPSLQQAASSSALGVIGLGADKFATENFKLTEKNFALYSTEHDEFKLLFNADFQASNAGTLVTTLKTNENWQMFGDMRVVTKSPGQFYHTYYRDKKVIFDLNTESVGLPTDIYNQVISNLGGSKFKNCTSEKLNTKCLFNGTVDAFPQIRIHLEPHNTVIIEPNDYIQDFDTFQNTPLEVVYLNFVDIKYYDPIPPSQNMYINRRYRDSIVLGAAFLKNYFTLFDIETKSVSIYQQLIQESSSNESSLRSNNGNKETGNTVNNGNRTSGRSKEGGHAAIFLLGVFSVVGFGLLYFRKRDDKFSTVVEFEDASKNAEPLDQPLTKNEGL